MLGSRGQAESLGVLFAVGITMVLSVTVFLTFGSLGGSLTDSPPGARIVTETNGGTVTFTHESGEVIDVEALTLVVRQGGDERQVPLSSVASGEFSSGDSISVPHGMGDGELSIRLVHDPTNGVLVKAVRLVEDTFGVTLSVSESGGTHTFDPSVSGGTEGAPVLTVSTSDISRFQPGQQDKTGSVTVTDDGQGLRLDGNSWKSVPYPYYVTDDTVVEFEYRSTKPEGEIHGLALDDDGGQNTQETFRVWGSQSYGTYLRDVDGTYYAAGDDWRQYRSTAGALGEFSAGSSDRIDRLVFVNDDDGDGGTSPGEGETHIRNVRLYESGADYQYRWEVNGNLVSNEPTFSSSSLSAGDTVTLTVVDADGRTTTATYTVS